MGENYKFFDSIDGEDERLYTADEFAEYFRQFIRNGIFNGGENLKVSTDEKDMKIKIKPGYAWIEGYLYKISGEDLILEHNISDPSLNRIDRVVIRLDKTLENRYVKAFILEGTPAATPKAPELTRDDNIYEISLAKIEIIEGKSFIENYQITDERLDNTVCGITTHLFEQVDTTAIFDEWENYLIHKRNESNLSYDEFVAAYQNTWNTWIEEKISEPNGEFYSEWKDWFNEIQDTTNLVTKSQFDEFKNTKGEANGLAELDQKSQVPTNQLENVQYLKDFYGRRSEIISYFDSQYDAVRNGASIGIFEHTGGGGQHLLVEGDVNDNIDLKFISRRTYPSDMAYSSYPLVYIYTNNFMIENYVKPLDTTNNYSYAVVASNKKYDLTNVDTVEFDIQLNFRSLASTNPNEIYMFVGISDSSQNSATSFSRSVKITDEVTRKTTVSVDTSNLTGEYWIKVSTRVEGQHIETSQSFGGTYARVYEVRFINNHFNENFVLDYNNKIVKLNSGVLSASLTPYQLEIPPQFLDWQSLNALVEIPNGASIKFNIYDNQGNILVEDVKNGETFQEFTAPIIKPQITLSRNSLDIPSPELSWLSLSMRGLSQLPLKITTGIVSDGGVIPQTGGYDNYHYIVSMADGNHRYSGTNNDNLRIGYICDVSQDTRFVTCKIGGTLRGISYSVPYTSATAQYTEIAWMNQREVSDL